MSAKASIIAACVLAGLASLALGPARAQTPANFYAGRTLNLIVGSTTGGYYDTGGRVVARYLGRFIPGNPAINVQNEPDSGGMAMLNRLANTAPRDGSTIAVISRALPQLGLVGDPHAVFDPLQLTWLGSLTSYQDDAYLMVVNDANPAHSLAEAMRPGRPIYLGGTRAGSTNITFALIARDLLKMNVDIVRGFPGAAEIWLAMERGELDGQIVDVSAIMVGRPQLWAAGKLRPLVAFGRLDRLAALPDVPVARELVTDPSDRALLEFAELPFFMALPFVAPPDLPPERAHILATAFMAMARDDEFRAKMKKAGILTSPIDGAAVHDLIAKAAATPMAVRERFARLLADK
jgi:tripartite-type tricarboxylate transporter receptor subunit TctC